jgi:hypothetical protein
MPTVPTKPEDRIRTFLSFCRFKLFHQDCDYVACYGQPAMTEDGWIINLPALDFFEGAYQSLPFEVELSATWVQEQSIIKQPFAKYISTEAFEENWSKKAHAAGMPNYCHADFFRDAASMLINHDQPSLALCFIQVAHDLRPKGPLICKMFDELTEKCKHP